MYLSEVLVFFLFSSFVPHVSNFSTDALAKRAISFEDSCSRKRALNGGDVLVIQSMSNWSECAANCNREPACRSFCICCKMTCELNSDDRFSTEQAEEILLDDENCNYFGMQQIETPDCSENGLPKDVRIDDRPGNCAINEERVDVEWSRWSTQIVVNTTTELKLLKTGRITIVESAHGGVDNNRT